MLEYCADATPAALFASGTGYQIVWSVNKNTKARIREWAAATMGLNTVRARVRCPNPRSASSSNLWVYSAVGYGTGEMVSVLRGTPEDE